MEIEIENLSIDSLNCSYVDKSGSYSNIPKRGDIITANGERYEVIMSQAMPRFCDGGKTPFHVVMKVEKKQK